MKVTLIDFTENAAEKLIFTKSTRLTMSPNLFNEIMDWDENKKLEELEYMSKTIPSSWEFVNYTFLIEGVSRGFTHQFVRTRQGSYAQQTMRMLAMENFEYYVPDGIAENPVAHDKYDIAMSKIQEAYNELLNMGCAPEDARGILPTNICTNICARFNLRTLSEMAKSRTGSRTQDEYRKVINSMLNCIIKQHPWAEKFLFPKGRDAFSNLEKLIENTGHCDLKDACKKDLDLLRKS